MYSYETRKKTSKGNQYDFRGLIITVDGENGGIHLVVEGRAYGPLANDFPATWWGQKNQTTVRWAVSDKDEWPETLDEIAADYLSVLEGAASTKYGARYSELTGYLWTDEEIKIGGHDFLRILYNEIGKYLWLEVIVHD